MVSLNYKQHVRTIAATTMGNENILARRKMFKYLIRANGKWWEATTLKHERKGERNDCNKYYFYDDAACLEMEINVYFMLGQ